MNDRPENQHQPRRQSLLERMEAYRMIRYDHQDFDLTVNLTAEHIATGKVEDCETCPLALAIRDALNSRRIGHHTVMVMNGVAVLDQHQAVLPHVAQEFMNSFDGLISPIPHIPMTFDLRFRWIEAYGNGNWHPREIFNDKLAGTEHMSLLEKVLVVADRLRTEVPKE